MFLQNGSNSIEAWIVISDSLNTKTLVKKYENIMVSNEKITGMSTRNDEVVVV